MRVLVDAQLPKTLAEWLRGQGVDATHTRDLPQGNRTSDQVIIAVADQEDRWVISKDADFVHQHLLAGRPRRLLQLALGNCDNRALRAVFVTHWSDIRRGLETATHLELQQSRLITHA